MRTLVLSILCLLAVEKVVAAEEFSGRWEGGGEGQLYADIRKGRQKPEYLVIRLETVGTRCVGEVTVFGVPANGNLSAESDNRGDLDAPVCKIGLGLKGGVMSVEEIEGCVTFHGAACGFSGELRRR